MHIPNPYFTNIPQLGSLKLDFIFVEDGYPLLFTCKSDNKIYLCLCRTLVPEQKWVISETNIDILGKMANREIPICDAFKLFNTKSCIALWSKANPIERYRVFPTADLQKFDLPDDELFLDEDDADDAVDYVKSLSREVALQEKLDFVSRLESECESAYTRQQEIKASINYGFAAYQQIFEQTVHANDCLMTTFYSGNSFESISRPSQSIASSHKEISNDLKMSVASAA